MWTFSIMYQVEYSIGIHTGGIGGLLAGCISCSLSDFVPKHSTSTKMKKTSKHIFKFWALLRVALAIILVTTNSYDDSYL